MYKPILSPINLFNSNNSDSWSWERAFVGKRYNDFDDGFLVMASSVTELYIRVLPEAVGVETTTLFPFKISLIAFAWCEKSFSIPFWLYIFTTSEDNSSGKFKNSPLNSLSLTIFTLLNISLFNLIKSSKDFSIL